MLIGPEKSLADDQSQMNQSTRGQWDWYASHRKNIERLIVPTGRGQRICVLGAGNCNDLDLKWLTQAYAEVHLVDIDPSALDRAARRQGVQQSDRLKLHAPVDLTGIADRTQNWRGRAVSESEVVQAVDACKTAPSALEGTFDVVLSPCVLSQLLCGVRDILGKSHAQWPALKSALRARHLREIAGQTAQNGKGVLVVDLSSSSTIPGLDQAKEEDLPGLLKIAIRDRKCFHGLEPAEIVSAIRSDAGLRRVFPSSTNSQPWLWHLGWGKAFLVYGMTLNRIDRSAQ